MMVFVVLTCDTHGGEDAEVFESAQDAENRAKKILAEINDEDAEVYLNDAMIASDWIFYASYDGGESKIIVMQCEVHSP